MTSDHPRRILVLGGGFAGLWAAVGAARKLHELGIGRDQIQVALVDQNDFHSIRVRNYEAVLEETIVPYADVLDPIGVRHLGGTVVGIDIAAQSVRVLTPEGTRDLSYDRLVLALGSALYRPDIPGMPEHCFDVDTYLDAKKLEKHLKALPRSHAGPERYTALVLGAGLTGIEAASELPRRLATIRESAGDQQPVHVILGDAAPVIGSTMGSEARAVIADALLKLGIETRTGIKVSALDETGASLASGERIPAATIVWCAGMRANHFTALLPVERDRYGRVPVDEFMRVRGLPHVFAAGDVACATIDGEHASVMSCQHSRPMGRHAGHNVVADLVGEAMLSLHIDWYVTVLDLGPAGAVYTEGWDRHVVATGERAKETKRLINRRRIYPPMNRDSAAILEAGAPTVQTRPEVEDRSTGAAPLPRNAY